MKNNPFRQSVLGSSFLLPAHGRDGARATINKLAPPKNFIAKFKQTGKKKKGCGENEFLPACSAARSAAVGWEAARPCSSKEAKPAKIDSLIEKIFCAHPLKNVSIFVGFVRRQAVSRWAGYRAAGAALVRILLVIGSDFIQEGQPVCKVLVSRPDRVEIIKNWRPDFRRKKFGFCSRQTAILAAELKHQQTFEIVLPNLIHKSRKRNLL